MSEGTTKHFITWLLTFASIVLALTIGELFIRGKNASMKNYDIEMWKYSKALKQASANPILGHEHIPNKEAVLQSVLIRTNDKGMRGGAISNTNSARRILFLGSSITLGWGVEEKETVSSVLDATANAKGLNIEVLNAGIGNYNAVRYTELFLTKLKNLNPDDIVIHYFVNDAEELKLGGGNWFMRNSQLAVSLWILVNRVNNNVGESNLLNHYQKVYNSDSVGYSKMVNALTTLSRYAKTHNIKLHLAMMPDIHNLTNYPFQFIHNKLERISTDLNMNYIDLLPVFSGYDGKSLWAMPGDPHPNAKAHFLMAQAILKHIQ